MQDLQKWLATYLHISNPKLLQELAEVVQLRKYQEGRIILSQYEMQSMHMILARGYVRIYYITDDGSREITERLVTKPGHNCMPGVEIFEPSPSSVQALTNVELICLPFGLLKRITSRYSEAFEVVLDQMKILWQDLKTMKRLQYETTTMERWLWFQEAYPNLDKIMKMQDIASFLNMTPGNLSRVRKHLLERELELGVNEEGQRTIEV